MNSSILQTIRRAARPLRPDADPGWLMERAASRSVVMLGEASHGTSEFYTWRDRISRRLIEEHGFRIIAVEGDWPACYRVNRYIRGMSDDADARDLLRAFDRWPTWMWANEEVVELVEWLREYNRGRGSEDQVGFYGLDVYSLWDSMRAVLDYLDAVDPDAGRHARRAYGCFDPFEEDVQEYAMATAVVPTSCEDEAISILRELRRNAPQYREDGREGFFNAEQNALVARNAELYYRTMVRGGPTSWNVRDTHMADTLDGLIAHHAGARAIVWEHNTHIGDARATDMARAGMLNLGQLGRERRGAEVLLVGFSSFEGSVIAARAWGDTMERMPVPPAREGSWDALLHEACGGDAILATDRLGGGEAVERPRGHRAIGVVYHPERERHGNYVPTVMPARYDLLLHLDRTAALRPLHVPTEADGDAPETYPTGL